jgi:hypothetical protein
MGTAGKATGLWISSFVTSGAEVKNAWSSIPLLYTRKSLWRIAVL